MCWESMISSPWADGCEHAVSITLLCTQQAGYDTARGPVELVLSQSISHHHARMALCCAAHLRWSWVCFWELYSCKHL